MQSRYSIIHVFAAAFITFAFSCSKIDPPAPANEDVLDGPLDGMTHAQNLIHLAGDVAFNDEVFTAAKGLGPVFVAGSCGTCHAGDGKGHPFSSLIRFGQTDSTGNQFMHFGGPQLQNNALPGFQPENIPAGATYSKVVPPANTGLGYLEAVSDADILALADPNDTDGDGIRGVPNWIYLRPYTIPRSGSVLNNGRYIGRFGKKAATYDLLQQTASAYNQDIGIASTYEPRDVYSGLDIDPEVSNVTIQNVVFYLQTLKAPLQRRQNDPDVIAGKQVFVDISCGKCHTPEMKTGYSPINALSYQTFFPYTDLLLHDMGPGLDDGYTEGNARTAEWRTPALWGLGLSKNSQGGDYFLLHDGRAHSITEAIVMHGGEATNSRNKYQALSTSEKQQLIRFLESL